MTDRDAAIALRNGLLESLGLLDQLTPTEQSGHVTNERLEAILASAKENND